MEGLDETGQNPEAAQVETGSVAETTTNAAAQPEAAPPTPSQLRRLGGAPTYATLLIAPGVPMSFAHPLTTEQLRKFDALASRADTVPNFVSHIPSQHGR